MSGSTTSTDPSGTDSPSRRKAETAPSPDDPRKPKEPTQLTKASWLYVLKRTVREFGEDQCKDLAAALVYYAVLALFPGLLAVVSVLGLFGQAQQTESAVLQIIGHISPQLVDTLRGPVASLTRSPAAGITFVVGILGGLWSASGYVGAFGRAMNRIMEVPEGRPIWKLRPTQLAITVVTVVLVVIGALILVISGPIATAIGNAIGLGPVVVFVWNIVKWPVLAAIAVVTVAILYYWSPNVHQPRFKWMSLGSLLALIVWALASVGFGFYVTNFSHYDKTYGSFGAIIIFLLWLWITNLALLFGAEFDSELERGRELQGGIHAAEQLQLPPRDTRKSEKNEKKEEQEVAQGRALRESHGRTDDPAKVKTSRPGE